jgi:TonB family protein
VRQAPNHSVERTSQRPLPPFGPPLMSNVRIHQVRLAAVTLSIGLLSGCAANQPAHYRSVYQVGGSTMPLDAVTAEQSQAYLANHGPLAKLTGPNGQKVEILNAPQPAMPYADIRDGVVGSVVVKIRFNETGTVEQAEIVSSTNESLSQCVLEAVEHWRVTPMVRDGRPSKLTVQQTFNFQVKG